MEKENELEDPRIDGEASGVDHFESDNVLGLFLAETLHALLSNDEFRDIIVLDSFLIFQLF